MIVKYKKVYEDALAPHRAHSIDAGADLFAHSVTVDEYGALEIGTGIAVEIPEGYVGLLFPRSSLSKYDLAVSNSVGVVDAGYVGEIKVKYKPLPRLGREDKNVLYPGSVKFYEVGDRCVQLVIMPIPCIYFDEVDNLKAGARGVGGYGSTGK